MSLYQQTLNYSISHQGGITITQPRSSPPSNAPTKIIFIISRDLTVPELECLKKHGRTELFSSLSPSDWKYLILDIRILLDRNWIMHNITNTNEYVVIITSDKPENHAWLKSLLVEDCVTNVMKKLPIIDDESFDRRVINSLWLPKRKSSCLCL